MVEKDNTQDSRFVFEGKEHVLPKDKEVGFAMLSEELGGFLAQYTDPRYEAIQEEKRAKKAAKKAAKKKAKEEAAKAKEELGSQIVQKMGILSQIFCKSCQFSPRDRKVDIICDAILGI